MALRLDSGSYGLRQANSANKTVLLVKLTDSALKIIESYQDHSGNLRSKPNIQFKGHRGMTQFFTTRRMLPYSVIGSVPNLSSSSISLTTLKLSPFINKPDPLGEEFILETDIIQIPVAGGGEKDVQKFSFQVSNLPQSAGVDCLKQFRSGHTGRVDCLGSIQQKITVNAKDDSYDMTRQRMTLAKQEEQKTSTKVIKQPGSKIRKMFKKTGKGRMIEKSHLSLKGKLSPDTRAPTPPMSRLTPTLLNRSSSPLTIPGKDCSISPPVPGSGRNKTKPTITISSSSASSLNQKDATSPSSASSAVAGRPLWDRVAHLLAVRSYKYPEIVIRLQRDKAADKTRLQDILSQVASARNVSGVAEYSLLRNIYQNLEPDTWPGYAETERKTVKKKISELSASNETHKRPYTNTFSPETNSDGAHEEEEYSNPTSKKQRVSHIKGRTSGASSPLEVDKNKPCSPATAISFSTAQLPSSKPQPPMKRLSCSPEKPKTVQNKISLPKVQDKRSPPEALRTETRNTNGFEDLPGEEDFLKKYIRISSDEQRDRYKKDFYAEYQEYLKHHSNVAAVSDRFADLQRKLKEHEKGSEEYKEISKKVIQEYRKTKKNDAYHRERARWQFLHRKLRHIKELVNTFDQHKLANSLPENESNFTMQTKTATRVA